jgi:fructokinase
MRSMIVVAGEALIDLVISPDGAVVAALGGAPYNTARAAARLGAEVHFVGGLSNDRFGRQLVDQLERDGVHVDLAKRTELPSTLAAAELDEHGGATYRFYFQGTAAPSVDADVMDAAVRALDELATGIFFTGGLALILEPMASAVIKSVMSLADDTFYMLDVNCRPAVVDDPAGYVERVRTFAARADIVKVSDEDLAYLSPELEPIDAARELLAGGARVVILTAGASPTTVVMPEASITVPVAPISGGVVDTIGAGDTFGAGVLAWWSASGFGRADLSIDRVAAAVTAGHAASAIVVSRRGADPPYLGELMIDCPS